MQTALNVILLLLLLAKGIRAQGNSTAGNSTEGNGTEGNGTEGNNTAGNSTVSGNNTDPGNSTASGNSTAGNGSTRNATGRQYPCKFDYDEKRPLARLNCNDPNKPFCDWMRKGTCHEGIYLHIL